MHSQYLRTCALMCGMLVHACGVVHAGDWPQWRGPQGDGVCGETDLPITWSDESGVQWKCKLPEWGDSTPAIWGDAVFVTSQLEDGALVLLRIDKQSGQLKWTRQVGVGVPRLPTSGRKSPDMRRFQEFHREQNMATPSPVTDGRVVIVHFGNGDLAAYDFDGRQLWRRNLQEDHGDYTIWWGHANSPLLCGDLVISVCMQDSCVDLPGKPSPSYVVAHDVLSGRQRWMTMRMTDATQEHCDAYTTPVLRATGRRQEIVVMGGHVLDAYAPATGERLWSLPGLVGNRLIPSPVVAHGMIYATQGMREPLLAVRVDGAGQRTRDEIVWEYDEGISDSPSPVVSGDLVYFVNNSGIARCLDAHSGRLMWTERLDGRYRASPLAADGRIYFLSTDGLATVVFASSKFERLAENQLDDETIASPAVSDGKIFIRGRKSLYCLGDEAEGVSAAEVQPPVEPSQVEADACTILADQRLDAPIRTIAAEYTRRTGKPIAVRLLAADGVNGLVETQKAEADAVFCMAGREASTPVSSLPEAKKVAWKHPTGEPVWGAVVGDHAEAADFVRFVGGPTGHRLWSESPAGFTIVSGPSHAEAFKWVADNRVAHTYPMTAMRMLRECGGIRDGVCIDIGCGPGNLDVELAKRSKLTIVGLDIDGDMKPLFEEKMRAAQIQDRVRFVEGDAQDLPFPDDYADMIVSRGTLTFVPDIAKCLREVDRVLKPTGVAFLGGRYVYTPHAYKISNERFKQMVADSGVSGAQVITDRGQWVKIIGPKAPEAARQAPSGPHMLAGRFVADYAIVDGRCLLLGRGDGGLEQGLQNGFLELTNVQITALYSKEEEAAKARQRIRDAKLDDRIKCVVGNVDNLPFDDNAFDAVAGAGPFLLWGEREKGMKEIHRVLRTGGAALVGGKFLGMPEWRKVSSETLRASAVATGIPSIRVIDDMGQWIEIRKGVKDRRFRD